MKKLFKIFGKKSVKASGIDAFTKELVHFDSGEPLFPIIGKIRSYLLCVNDLVTWSNKEFPSLPADNKWHHSFVTIESWVRKDGDTLEIGEIKVREFLDGECPHE